MLTTVNVATAALRRICKSTQWLKYRTNKHRCFSVASERQCYFKLTVASSAKLATIELGGTIQSASRLMYRNKMSSAVSELQWSFSHASEPKVAPNLHVTTQPQRWTIMFALWLIYRDIYIYIYALLLQCFIAAFDLTVVSRVIVATLIRTTTYVPRLEYINN